MTEENDSSIQRFQEQVAASRAAASERLARKYRLEQRQTQGAVSFGFDANSGRHIIQLPDGSIRHAQANTNGALGAGDVVDLHQASGITSVDQMPSKRRKIIPQPKNLIRQDFSFWILSGNYITEWKCSKQTATIKLVTNSNKFPAPYNIFHGDIGGLCRINKNEFYVPSNHRVAKHNIQTLTAETVIGEPHFDFSANTIQGIHSTYTSTLKDYFFSAITNGTEELRIYHINSSGNTSYTMITPNFNLSAEVWSIAAINTNEIYLVFFNEVFAFFDKTANELTYIFTSTNQNLPSLYGSIVEGYEINEILYAFMDQSNKTCYITVLLRDSGVPGLQAEYQLNNITTIGVAPETDPYGGTLYVVKADFPPGIVMPGDYIDTGGSSAPVYKVIDDSTVYTFNIGTFNGIPGVKLNTTNRHLRTAIFKVVGNTLSLYYRFPTIDNRIKADGYRFFFNRPCRGALIDPLTKDIYMYAERNDVIINGMWQFVRENGFGKGNLVKITPSKKLVILDNKIDSTATSLEQEAIILNWDEDDSQLEPIYK